MQPTPLISIVIPAFNVADYFGACLTSVLREVDGARALAQANFEIIVVDDGSEDGTAALARELLGDRPDARLTIHPGNRGPAAARNTGIDASRGDYILFVDGDNTLLEGALPRIVRALLEHVDADAIVLGMDMMDVTGERTGRFYGTRAPADPLGRLRSQPFLMLDVPLIDTFCIIRASAARLTRFDECLRQVEDWDFWMRFHYEHQCRFAMLEDSVGSYRVRPGQRTREHILHNMDFGRAILRIYAKALAIAASLQVPAPVLQRLLRNVRNAGSTYLAALAYERLEKNEVRQARAIARRSLRIRASVQGALIWACPRSYRALKNRFLRSSKGFRFSS